MGDPRGFLKVARQDFEYRPVCERIRDFKHVAAPRTGSQSQEQASRCMDCATPFCHWGCPAGNYIPEWNDYMHRGDWKKALALLEATNNLPEITGRVCPAPCEYACVLGLNDDAVTIRENELAVIEYGFKSGLIEPLPVSSRSGKKIAVVGSGPAGLCCAAQLNRAGHRVIVFERDDRIGGILRYGIPDFKLEKSILDRRLQIWRKEGIEFKAGIEVGKDYPARRLSKEFDAVCIAAGSRIPRDLKIDGRDFKGIHFAMDYLVQSNRRVAGEKIPAAKLIDAKGKRVVVIGGGDTGSDCVGVAHRQGASCVAQIEILAQPPECRTENQPWPAYPLLLKASSSHQEGGERHWAVATKRFIGENGAVKKLCCVKLDSKKEIPGSEFEIAADLVILAMGFLCPKKEGLLEELGVELDERGNVKCDDNFMTSEKNIFACGDMRRGQSLVVWAISEGRRCAYNMDKFLIGESNLPTI
ncbi:glutamate synthase subunit beta [Candidatus Omnitrophota bacterium]